MLFSISRKLVSVIGFDTSNNRKSSRKTLALAASAAGVQSALPSRMSQSARLSISRLRNSGLEFVGNRKRSLLIPQVAQVVRPCQSRIVETHVGLFRAADPVETRRIMSDKTTGPGQRGCLGNGPEQRTFAGVEHAASIEFDDDAKHVVVLQQIGEFSLAVGRHQPGKKEGIGAQARKYAEHSVRGRRPFFVIDDKTQHLAIGKGTGAALDRLVPSGPGSRASNRQLKRYSSSPVLNFAASPRPATVARRTTIE